MANAIETKSTLIGTLWPDRTSPALRWITLMVVGSAFLAICAQINVPLYPVPITMQTFGVLLIGMVFGSRLGAATVAAYLFEGAIGLPVYAQHLGGLPVLLLRSGRGPRVGSSAGWPKEVGDGSVAAGGGFGGRLVWAGA